MSKLKRLLGALSLVALFIFSSCVDDEIAPEVTALRQAQVDLLNADVAFRTAETALKNADVAYRNAQVANQEALTATVTIGNDQTLALNVLALELATEQNRAALVAAEQALLTAQNDLAQYLATQGLEEAAEYLATWNAIMTGGSTPMVADLEGNVPAGGLAGLAQRIAAKQAEVAGLELFYTTSLSPGPQIPQSALIARAEESVTTAEAALTALNASLEAAQLVIDGDEDPAAPIDAALLALAADTVVQNARIDSIADVISGISESLAVEDSIVSAFEGQNAAANLTSNRNGFGSVVISGIDDPNNAVPRGALWVTRKNNIDDANAIIAVQAADTVVWLAYADSLEGVYNKYKTTIDDFEAYIKPFRDDSISAADALAAAQPSGPAASINEIAHAQYVAALEVFTVKSNNFLNELAAASNADSFDDGITSMTGTTYDGDETLINVANRPTLADTTALVNARVAWDGLTKNLMFEEWQDDRYDANVGGTRFTSDLTDNGAAKLLANSATADGIANGSDNPYNNATAGVDPALEDARNLANALLVAAEQEFDQATDEFAALNTAIAGIRAQTYDSREFTPLDFGDATASPTFTTYDNEVNGAGSSILDASTGGLSTSATDIKTAKAAIATQNTAIETNEDLITDDMAFTAPYVDAYVAALASLKDLQSTTDSLKIGPTFAAYGAQETLNALEAQMTALKEQKDALENTTIVIDETTGLPDDVPAVIFTDVNGMTYTSVSGTNGLQAYVTGAMAVDGDVDQAEDAITSAVKAVSDAINGQTTLEGLLAEAQTQLAAMETEQTVWQGIADSIQALLLAALAG